MALTNEYRVTDDDGHLDSVSIVPGEDEEDDLVIISSAGSEISLTPSMARETIEAIQNVLKYFSR